MVQAALHDQSPWTLGSELLLDRARAGILILMINDPRVDPLLSTPHAADNATATVDVATTALGQRDTGEGMSAAIPLLIDLEHALLPNHLLIESTLAYMAVNPLRIVRLVGWAWQGREHLRGRLLEAVELDPALMPLNEEVVALAAAAKREGRQVFLVAAGNEWLARKLALRIPVIDDIFLSGGAKLAGGPRADAVNARFPDGYDYIGNSATDLDIWRNARKAIVVAPSPATLQSINKLAKPATIIPGRPRLGALMKASRLHQLAKNALIFVPAILSGTIVYPETLISCLLAFIGLGLVAIGGYLINDILDIAHDRRHWSKRLRPIASGDLPLGTALATAVASIALGLAIGAAVSVGVLIGLSAYLALTFAYSIHVKRLAILDVVVLAILFTLRLAIGISAAQVYASPWLLVFSMSLFTSLSFAKRFTEIKRTEARGEAALAGRGYITADAPLVLGLGLATGTASVLILVLYLIFDAFNHEFYGNPHWLWCFPLVLFLWVSRIWLISQRGELNDDPVAFALGDRQSLALGALMVAAFILAWIGAPL